ncbi:MAG: Mannose-1-phosphate guanylyltransferase 1 [Chlamydiales bacterium]|nr:Mannose-1-phosphate guanylyltransferase 1 [Chlamydiales bacterium]MCH9619612.1 Mannose-1-phosphate guanylyltransferase 1 [Chlamydiales bacterium]MCH9623218.1 Mannose-1-phosphate guanylyltransferase 1 [Chlamydiales bacterium]
MYIITHPDAYNIIVDQVPELKENILLEPAPKNTAPAVVFAMEELIKRGMDPKEPLFICPADHLIAPEDLFCDIVKEAIPQAEAGKIVTFGIRPTRAETGYGYIHGESAQFVEKPTLAKAQEYVASGKYFWNSGMFLFTIETMQKEFERLAPNLDEPISLDYAIMEKSDKVTMAPMNLNWSDVGSWENLYELLDKDERGNVIKGEVVTHETTDSLIFAEKRLVTTIGLKDMLVVATDDALLVAPKSESQKVKEIVGQLKNRDETIEHLTVSRPWGSFTVLEEGTRFKMKRITVNPLQKLSLQMHYHRSEHWVVVSGTANVTIQGKESIVHEGESIFVPKSAIHRMENPGKVSLEIIEVQVGEYLGEDDIVRFEDVYGRLKDEASFRVLLNKK